MKLGIVLAARTEKPGQKGAKMLPRHFKRLEKGLELYRNGKVDKLVVTCSYQFGYPPVGQPFYIRSVRWLVKRGVPSKDILRVRKARLTIEEAVGIRPIIEKHSPTEIHLVTSSYQMKRAVAIFKEAYPHLKLVSHEVQAEESQDPQHVFRDVRNIRRWRRSLSRSSR